MSGSLYIANGRVLSDGALRRANVTVEAGHVTRISSKYDNPFEFDVIDAAGQVILPGFIDVHTHGAAGHDVNASSEEDLRAIGRFFASQGVTGWLCSILTDTPEQTLWCIGEARKVIEGGTYDGAALLGIHLEGPCLSSEYKGAMPEHLLMHEADISLFEKYQEAAGGHILYTTLAPEVPGVPDLIGPLAKIGITAAIGHSGAGYDLSWACIRAGAKSVTHVGNAMRLFHQHDPAIFGVALESDAYAETICDGRHLHPGTVRLYVKAKGWDRILGITDSIMAAGLPDGNYKLGVNDVVVEDGDAKLASNGVRAGSTLTQIQALRNFMKFTGAGVEEASKPMTQNPADLFGWTDKGRVFEGSCADLVLIDANFEVARTIVAGETVYKRG